MTKTEWIQKARDNADDLRDLIAEYHPGRRGYNDGWSEWSEWSEDVPITAPMAEKACQAMRKEICKKSRQDKLDPVEKFDRALAGEDIGTIMSLLNGAWIGVPESTSCWGIRGFEVAVDLLDDPPEQEEDAAA